MFLLPATANSQRRRSRCRGSTAGFTFEIDPPTDACYVISCEYFDRGHDLVLNPGTFSIEALGTVGTVGTVGTDGGTGVRRRRAAAAPWLGSATAFLTAMTVLPRRGWTAARLRLHGPDVMGDPSVWRESEGGGRGTPDQTYALGPYALAADEALELDLVSRRARMPASRCGIASARAWIAVSTVQTLNHREVVVIPTGTRASSWLIAIRACRTGSTPADVSVARSSSVSCSPSRRRSQSSAL